MWMHGVALGPNLSYSAHYAESGIKLDYNYNLYKAD